MNEQSMTLRAGRFAFHFPRPSLVMGIVNVTPDSFSDGGRFLDPAAAVAHAESLVAQGAEILDVGGESTRPGARPVSEDEERRRVLPVIERLSEVAPVPVSIDTTKPGVARAALAAGASIVNDVAASRPGREAMWRVLTETGAGYVCMHMQGSPQTMQDQPAYQDVVGEIHGFFTRQLEALTRAGVAPETVVLDVGIGFGKALEHNLKLLGGLDRFKTLGRPMLLGVSRKSFIGGLFNADVSGRLPASLACACWAVAAGVRIIRTHDVAETVQAVRMIEAIDRRQPSCSGNS